MTRIKQRTLSHCGPAVLSMLVNFNGIKIDQDRFVTAARVSRSNLRSNGMDLDQLAISVVRLLPDMTFWIKREATIDDVADITNTYKYPVGVEWQGVFGEWSNGDDGHYSVIINVDKERKKIILIDPFWYYSGSDRTFTIDLFVTRWWDSTIRLDKKTGDLIRDTDQQAMFVITPKSETFPKKVGMYPYRPGKFIRFGGYSDTLD
jgi:hypothetical protein